MPHDANGVLLTIGDAVILRGKVKSIDSEQETYCNINLVADRGMEPSQDGTGSWSSCLSARMVEKVEEVPRG